MLMQLTAIYLFDGEKISFRIELDDMWKNKYWPSERLVFLQEN